MNKATIVVGKAVSKASRLAGNSGTAVSGLVAERLNPNLIATLNEQLPMGVVVITGTNGKTTTTKMVVELLQSQGLKVFTNKSGSNFTRGVLSAMIDKSNFKGKLDFDIGVLEFDEAHLKYFTSKVQPKLTVVTNLFRDQLDRYGEVATTAKHIEAGIKDCPKVVLYSGDRQVVDLSKALKGGSSVSYFGVKAKLRKQLPNDIELHGHKDLIPRVKRQVTLQEFSVNKGQAKAEYKIDNKTYKTNLQVRGLFNALNATAALCAVKCLLPQANNKQLVKALENITPAFGRGEVLDARGKPLVLGLVKNPAGFNQNLNTLVTDSTKQILIVVNDNFADGRDVSWYWDVDVSVLKKFKGEIYVAGERCYDMTLRLMYDNIQVKEVDQDPQKILEPLKSTTGELVILPTYTAMLNMRKSLTQYTSQKEIY